MEELQPFLATEKVAQGKNYGTPRRSILTLETTTTAQVTKALLYNTFIQKCHTVSYNNLANIKNLVGNWTMGSRLMCVSH